MEALLGLGVDAPERATNEISTEAVVGVVRWAQDQNRKGRAPASGQIVHKLRNGGLAGYGELGSTASEWWRTWQGREAWLETNAPELDPEFAEAAIISLLNERREPTVELVRTYAERCEQEQLEHDAKCRKAVEAQTKRPARSEEKASAPAQKEAA